MILLLAEVGFIIGIIAFIYMPVMGASVMFIIKPVIDATWDQAVIGDIRLTQLISTLVVVFIMSYMFLGTGKGRKVSDMPLHGIWLLYLADIVLFSSIFMMKEGFYAAFNIFFRQVSGFIGYYMVQTYFNNDKRVRQFFAVLIIAGIFPVAVGMFELLTGVSWKHAETEGIVRHIGLYHDAFTVRFYMLQTILGLVIFVTLDGERKSYILKIFLFVIGVCALIVLFRAYSKSGIATIGLWVLMWAILKRQLLLFSVFVVIGIALSSYYMADIFDQIFQMFHKEVGAVQGSIKVERTFAGRWYGWEELIDTWLQLGAFEKIFGSGISSTNAHNDYLMLLMHGGILGLLIYISLILMTGIRLVKNVLKKSDTLAMAGLMAFCVWMIDAVGLVPSAYTGYQWFVWGVIGLSLRQRRDKVSESIANEDTLDSIENDESINKSKSLSRECTLR